MAICVIAASGLLSIVTNLTKDYKMNTAILNNKRVNLDTVLTVNSLTNSQKESWI